MKPHLRVQIARFVDDRFPGWVEAEFSDAEGVVRTIRDKYSIFTDKLLDSSSSYPQLGAVACVILVRWNRSDGVALARVETPGVEATTGESQFIVTADQIITPSGLG